MDNQVNNTFNPVGLVGGVKKEGISEEKINEISNNFVEIKDQLNRIEDLMISVKDNFNKRVETIKLESVMPTPVNAPEEQVEQPIDAPTEPIEENDFNKTEDLSDVMDELSRKSGEQLENINVMSEPQTAENVPETNTIDSSTSVEVPNPIQEEETPNIEGAVALANSEAPSETNNFISFTGEDIEKQLKETEPNFAQVEVSQIEEEQPNNVVQFPAPQDAPAQEAAPVVPEQPQLVETVAAVPAQEQVQAVQPNNVVQFPTPQAASEQEAAPVVPEQPQLVEPVVAVQAQEPVQATQPNNVVQFPAPQATPIQEAAPVTEPENNVEKVTGVVIQAAFGEGKQRSEVVSQEQQENLKKEVVSKTLTNTMPSMANAA